MKLPKYSLILSITISPLFCLNSFAKDNFQEIDYQKINNHLYIKANISKFSGNFILDTGAGACMLDAKIAEEILKNEKIDFVFPKDSLEKGHGSFVYKLNSNNIEFSDMTFVFSNKNKISENIKKYDKTDGIGIIGFPIFKNRIISIDYANKKLRIYNNDFKISENSKLIELDLDKQMFKNDVPQIKLSKNKKPYSFLIDTGADDFVVSTKVQKDWDLKSNEKKSKNWNEAKTTDYLIKNLELEQFNLNDLHIEIADEDSEFPSESINGLIGNKVFEKFGYLTIDGVNAKVYLGKINP